MSYQYMFDALYDNNIELFKELLNEQVIFEAKSTNGFGILHAAVNLNRFDILQYCLSKYETPINERDIEGRSPFHLACELEIVDLNILNILIKYNADINTQNKEGMFPIHAALRNGNISLVKLLILNNVLITTNELNGYTVLHYIALSNCITSLRLLLNYKSFDLKTNLNKQDFDGCTALMLAVDVANIEIAKELVNIGADCNVIGRDITALHLATVTQEAGIFEILWYKTDFNIIIKLSETNNLVKLLIKYGWFFPDRINIFFKVLDHPNILHILKEEIKIFTIFFYRVRFVKNIQDIDIKKIVIKLLKIGVKPTQNDLRVFLLNFYRFENNFEILNIFVQKGNAKIDDKYILKFIIELYPKLIPKLLFYCVKNNPIDIINYFTEILRINKDMIKLILFILHFCTPCYILKKNLVDHLANFCYAILNVGEGDLELLYLYEYIITILKNQKVPSLMELSRDVTRSYLAQSCNDFNEYLNVINKLRIPKDVLNILQCQHPVNILMDV